MKETLEEVLEDERRQAKVLADNGHENDANLIRRVCDRAESAAAEYVNFMSEPEAILRTGKSERQLRRLYAELEPRGHAKKIGAMRYYRECILEPRKDLSAARKAGRRAAEKTADDHRLYSR
jgi:hypothetical protein